MGCRKRWAKARPSTASGSEARLGIDQLQFVAGALLEFGAGFGADADPVDGGGHRQGAVGLDGDLEARVMQGGDERVVDLQHRLAAGQHDEGRAGGAAAARQALGKIGGGGKAAAARAVRADEIGVAEAGSGPWRDPARGPTRDCSRRSGRRRRRGRRSRPRPAACRRSL